MVGLMEASQNDTQPADKLLENMTPDMIKEVGCNFVLQYYTVMSKCPQYLHRFYTVDSSVVRGNATVSGQTPIHQLLMTLDLKGSRALVLNLSTLKSHMNSIVIQVTGEISINESVMRRFMQTFVLVQKSSANFFVLNDIFQYQDEVYGDIRVQEDEVESKHSISQEQQVAEGNYTSMYETPAQHMSGNSTTLPAPSAMEECIYSHESEADDIDYNGQDGDYNVPVSELSQELEPSSVSHELPSEPIPQVPSDPEPQVTKKPTVPDAPRSWAALVSTTGNSGGGVQISSRPQQRVISKPRSEAIIPPVASTKQEVPVQPQTGDQRPRNQTASPNESRVDSAKGGRNLPDNTQIFVGNLPHTMTEDELGDCFKQFGPIVEARINQNHPGKGAKLPNFGFVAFENSQVVRNVLSRKPIFLPGNNHRLNVEEKKPQSSGGGQGSRYNNPKPGMGARPSFGGDRPVSQRRH